MNTANNFTSSNQTTATTFKKKASGLGGSLGFKNVLILFFSAMAVSLVVLVIFFGLFFQKVDFSLNTKPLENAPIVIDPDAPPLPDETENNTPLTESQVNEVFNEININVPTDAYKMRATLTPSNTTNPIKKTKPSEAYVGVGATNTSSGGGGVPDESATDVQVETAPPLPPKAGRNKTAPVAENNGSSKTDEPSSSSEPDFMPMAPVPSQ